MREEHWRQEVWLNPCKHLLFIFIACDGFAKNKDLPGLVGGAWEKLYY